MAQTVQAINSAHVALFVTDRKQGLSEWDYSIAKYLLSRAFPVLHVINKFDHDYMEPEIVQEELAKQTISWLGKPIPISADHNYGIPTLFQAIQPFYMRHVIQRKGKQRTAGDDGVDQHGELRLAIVGRPNVGKSTMLNRIIGEDRVVVSEEPGTTRDSIEVRCKANDKNLVLIDTAGLRKKKYVEDNRIEEQSLEDTLRSIRFANVVALLIDATTPLTREELEIAASIEREGRGLVLVANKWDLVQEKHKTAADIESKISNSLAQIAGLTAIVTSAKEGKNLELLLKQCFDCYDRWNIRISTGRLNRFVQKFLATQQNNLPDDFPTIHYITQVGTRPPSFAIFFKGGAELPARFERQILNAIREEFGLQGVPVRISQRGSSSWKQHVQKKEKEKTLLAQSSSQQAHGNHNNQKKQNNK